MREAFAKKAGLYFVAWTAFALFFFSESYTKGGYWRQYGFWHGSPPLVPLLASWLAQAYTWALLTPAVLWLGRRFPFAESRHAVHGFAHIALSVLFASVATLVVSAIAPQNRIPRGEIFRVRSAYELLVSPFGFHHALIAYWIIFCLQFTVIYYRKYGDLQRRAVQLSIDEATLRSELVDAELSRLRGQLHPELLSDALDGIMAHVNAHEYRRAEDLLTALADLLRCALDHVDSRTVPLGQELEHVRTYLAFEELRRGGRVRLQLGPDPTALDAAVMPASIRPIVERVLELIVDQLGADAAFAIRAGRVRDLLKVEIECSARVPQGGVLVDVADILEKMRRILRQFYGELFRLRAVDRDGATTVTLLLPYQMVRDAAASLSRAPVTAGAAKA